MSSCAKSKKKKEKKDREKRARKKTERDRDRGTASVGRAQKTKNESGRGLGTERSGLDRAIEGARGTANDLATENRKNLLLTDHISKDCIDFEKLYNK